MIIVIVVEHTSNNSKRSTRIYKDLDLDFGRNTVTNDVNKLTDVEAVKRSVRNLINTNHFERPFHPEIGGNVRALLFENMTPLTALNLQRKIEEVLNNFEPRAKITQILADPDIDRNGYRLEIKFLCYRNTKPNYSRNIFRKIR